MTTTLTTQFLALAGILAVVLGASEAPDAADEAEIEARSLVRLGDTARLEHALAKARRGERVVVGVIGGSITAGAAASTEANRWGNRVALWWRESFPQAEIVFVNAGIGATGSDIAAHRVQPHLLERRPDFVGIEFAVNDGGKPFVKDTLEGVVRQVLKQPNRPAAMLLFTMHQDGSNVQDQHAVIGDHYGLPMVSFRDALWPEIKAGRIAWTDIEADAVHPNDRGHDYCARFVTRVLDAVLADLPADADLPPIAPLPGPKASDVFEHAAFYNAETLAPVRNDGWDVLDTHPLFGPGWRSATPGSALAFEVQGTAIGLLFYRIKGAMGIAEAAVDNGPPVRMDAWFSADWGGYTPYELIARDLPQGKHTVTVTLLDEKHEASTGHEFRLHAVMPAGLPHD